MPHPGEVDVDHALPRVLRHVLRREGRRGDAGVGADNVKPTELGNSFGHDSGDRRVVAYVGRTRDYPLVQGLDDPYCLGQVLKCRARIARASDIGADVQSDNVGAFLREPDSVAAPLTGVPLR